MLGKKLDEVKNSRNMVFDEYKHAKKQYDECRQMYLTSRTGLIVAFIVSVVLVLLYTKKGMFDIKTRKVIELIAIFASILSYLFSGGLLRALGTAKELAFWGWIIFPFPISIVTGLTTLVFALAAFLFCPIVIVGLSHIENAKQMKEMQDFIGCYYDINDEDQ